MVEIVNGFGFHAHVYTTPAGILHALRILTVNKKVHLYAQYEKPRILLLQISIRGFIPIATIHVTYMERCQHAAITYLCSTIRTSL